MKNFYAALAALCLSFSVASAADVLSLQVVRHDGSVAYSGALESVGSVQIRNGVCFDIVAAMGGKKLFSGLLADVKRVTMTVAAEIPSAVVEVADAPRAGNLAVTPSKADRAATVQGVAEGTEVAVFDVQGKMVRRGVAPLVSLWGVPPGVYIFRAAGSAAKVIYR